MLDKERTYYNSRRRKLRERYQDKYVVVVGKKIMGVYDTHSEAYDSSRKLYEVGEFLICNTSLPHRV